MEQQDVVNGISTIFLANNIRMLRKRLNLSQEELAGQVGLNRGNIASYENGSAEPRICSMVKLSHIFGISMVDLILHDLTDEHTFQMASTNFQQRNNRDKAVMESFMKKTDEFKAVMEGLHTCHQFKMRSASDETTPREVQAMAHKFEELYEVAAQLLENHNALIEFVRCRLKQKTDC